MKYFKIIQDSNIIGIGNEFLKWYKKSKRYYKCPPAEAECVLDNISQNIYRPGWMNGPPPEAYSPKMADVVYIDDSEYEELYALLNEGEEIPVSEPEYIPQQEVRESSTDERPMTIREMRDKIAELTALVEQLINKN